MSGAYAFHLSEISDADRLSALWRSLETEDRGSIFTSWQWIGTWLKTLPADIRPRLLIVRAGSADIAAAVLVMQKTKHASAFAPRRAFFNATGRSELDTITIEHNGFVSLECEVDRLWSELLAWFATQNIDELFVPGLSSPLSVSGLLADQEAKAAYRRNDLAALSHTGVMPKLSRNTRQQISKAIRALQQFGELRLSVATDAIEALDYFQKMKELHVRSWASRKKEHAFRHSYFEIFHRRMIKDYAESGTAQMLRIAAGEHVVGYLYNFFYSDQVYAYQSGFDIGLNALKPGYICHALAIDHYAKRGAKTYDFLAGTNQLKQSLSNEHYPLFWVRAGRKTFRNRVIAAARGWLRRRTQAPT